jgi:hypothetical protein
MSPEVHNKLRQGVLAALGKVPEIGELLSGLVGLFWSEEENAKAAWDAIEKYAVALVNKSINEQALKELNGRLQGYKNAVRLYSDDDYGSPEKGPLLDALVTSMTVDYAAFTDRANLRKTFANFTVYGTLYLTAMAERAFYYEHVFGKPDKQHALHLKQFQESLKLFTATAQSMFDELYEWRFAQLTISESRSDQVTYYQSTWALTDNYYQDNKDKRQRRETGQGGNGSGFHAPASRAVVERYYATRVEEIRQTYVEDLQGLFAVAELWKYLDPSLPRPQSTVIVSQHGMFGGDMGRLSGNGFSANLSSPNSRITRVRIHHDSVVEGLEIFYDGVSGGKHGAWNSNKTVADLTLDADETIVEVSGRAGDFIDYVKFVTSKGRSVEGGGGTGRGFSSKGHETWKGVSLFGVGGSADSRRMLTLDLLWRHTVETEPYIPSYKRTGVPVTLGATFTVQDAEGHTFSAVTEEYSGADAAWEYYAHPGGPPVKHNFGAVSDKAQQVHGNNRVHIATTEGKVNNYTYLAKYRNQCYYYKPNGDESQMWEVVKMIPSDGPVLFGEKIYLRNVWEVNYIRPDGDYLGCDSLPHAWTFVAA